MRVGLPGIQQFHDRRRFCTPCARAEAKVSAQFVRPHVRRLAPVEQEVDLANRVNDGTGPGVGFAGCDRRRALAAKLGCHQRGLKSNRPETYAKQNHWYE
jgi:hypothetical protein